MAESSCVLSEDVRTTTFQRQSRHVKHPHPPPEATRSLIPLTLSHGLKLSLMLWLLALMGGAFDEGRIPALGFELCLTFATA